MPAIDHYTGCLKALNRPAVFVAVGLIAVPAAGMLYLRHLHKKLSKKTIHALGETGPYRHQRPVNMPARASASDALVITDCFQIRVPTKVLPPLGMRDMLTTYLRASLSGFARLPQGYIFQLQNKDKQHTQGFTRNGIQTLDFQVGDLILGMYEVIRRDDAVGQVELGFGQGNHVRGAMILSIQSDGFETTFSTQSIMWDAVDFTTKRLPLANRVVRYWHELTAMWLLVVGTRALGVNI
ncbi:hypothetical protein BC832DRAFT_25850 [Gaertneriomyces semiglobifer]|nr:hypothetical protein BC832DRAFT_25850 [Gaertneriomyces semiglobifer]